MDRSVCLCLAASWVSLGVSLTVINLIGFVNEDPNLSAWIPFDVPYPLRSVLVLISSILLVLGSTVFRLGCPTRIQEFSESQWVEAHRNPRPLYLSESLNRLWLVWAHAGFYHSWWPVSVRTDGGLSAGCRASGFSEAPSGPVQILSVLLDASHTAGGRKGDLSGSPLVCLTGGSSCNPCFSLDFGRPQKCVSP